MSWPAVIWKNLLRRPARTVLTAVGVGLGVALIVALLATTNGVHRTAEDLTHVGRADFGLYQADVSDFPRSLLPESLAREVAHETGVAAVAKIKLLVVDGTLVFGLDPRVVLPLHTVEALAHRPGEITSIGVTVTLGHNVKAVARRLEHRYPGVAAITEPGDAIKVDTSSRLIVSTGWIVSLLALIVGGIAVANTMAMSVFERTREIGILRAVGWSGLRVGAMIVSEALCICLLALAVGCALGVLAAQLFVGRSALSGLISPSYTASTFAWGLAFALGVGLIGALYPVWRAVSLEPVAALRHE